MFSETRFSEDGVSKTFFVPENQDCDDGELSNKADVKRDFLKPITGFMENYIFRNQQYRNLIFLKIMCSKKTGFLKI